MKATLAGILRESSLCAGMEDTQIECLAQNKAVSHAVYMKNDVLFWTEHAPAKLYVLIEGNIAMAKDTVGGKRSLSKSNVAPGDLIGEVRLFSPKKLLWEYAIALEQSHVLEFESSMFLRPGAIDPAIQAVLLRNIVGTVVEKIDYLGEKVRLLSLGSVRERISYYLFSIQDVEGRIVMRTTREQMADYLGIARPSLSRELGRMQDEGIIKLVGKEVLVTDAAALEALLK